MLKSVSLVLMGLLYIVAGALHFAKPDLYLRIVPPWLPAPLAIVYLSGVAEILLGAGVLVPRTSRLACWGVVALLIAIFPANLYHWWANVAIVGKTPQPLSYHLIRLPLQGVLIAWAIFHATRPR